jgi:hypothetical protein
MWNEVERATGSGGGFEVGTANATATVRGTAFAVTCVQQACSFRVVEGTVDVTAGTSTVSVSAGQQVGVDATGQLGSPVALVIGPFIQQNLDQDVVEQRDPPRVPSGTAAGTRGRASRPTAADVARALRDAYNGSIPSSILAPFRRVTCSGTQRVTTGSRLLCTASAGGASVPYRVVVLTGDGTFSATSGSNAISIAALESFFLSTPATASDGSAQLAITSASCEGGPVVVVALPGGSITCHLGAADGTTFDGPYVFDSTGAGSTRGTFR